MKIVANIMISLVLIFCLVLLGLGFYETRKPDKADLSTEHVAELRQKYDAILEKYQGLEYHDETLSLEMEDNSKLELKNKEGDVSLIILLEKENIKMTYPVAVENNTLNIGTQYVSVEDRGWETFEAFIILIILTMVVILIFIGFYAKVNDEIV